MLRVVGMSDTMKLKNRGGNDSVNRRISLLVLNHDTEAQIERENAESDAVQINDASSLKQIAAPEVPSTATNNQDPQQSQAESVSTAAPVTSLPAAPAPTTQTDRDSQPR
mgnify:CR=1 FL=1